MSDALTEDRIDLLISQLRNAARHQCCECNDLTEVERPCRYCKGNATNEVRMVLAAKAIEYLRQSRDVLVKAMAGGAPTPSPVVPIDAFHGMRPGDTRTVTVGPTQERGHKFEVTVTVHTGLHTGRPLYRVVCMTCDALVHTFTTGPRQQIEYHLREWESKRDIDADTTRNGDGLDPALRDALLEFERLIRNLQRLRNDRRADANRIRETVKQIAEPEMLRWYHADGVSIDDAVSAIANQVATRLASSREPQPDDLLSVVESAAAYVLGPNGPHVRSWDVAARAIAERFAEMLAK